MEESRDLKELVEIINTLIKDLEPEMGNLKSSEIQLIHILYLGKHKQIKRRFGYENGITLDGELITTLSPWDLRKTLSEQSPMTISSLLSTIKNQILPKPEEYKVVRVDGEELDPNDKFVILKLDKENTPTWWRGSSEIAVSEYLNSSYLDKSERVRVKEIISKNRYDKEANNKEQTILNEG